MDSYEKVLIAWCAAKDCLEQLEGQEKLLNEVFNNYSVTIFDAFLQSRLSNQAKVNLENPVETIQFAAAECDDDSVTENEDSDNDDLHRYKVYK